MDDTWHDRSVVEAASWRLVSELVRRHPHSVRVFNLHPGGGLYDCLTLHPLGEGPGAVHLNREGTIQVHERFDGRAPEWRPRTWDDYLRADPRKFLHELEVGCGLPSPSSVPPSTPCTITLRVLAAIAATGFKTVDPISIRSGMFDTSGYGAGVDEEAFAAFPAIPDDLRRPTDEDHLGTPEYQFWFVYRNEVPILGFHQRLGLAWTPHHDVTFDLSKLYDESRRHLLVTALKLLRQADQI